MSSQCIDFTDTALPVWKHFSAKSGICSFWVLDLVNCLPQPNTVQIHWPDKVLTHTHTHTPQSHQTGGWSSGWKLHSRAIFIYEYKLFLQSSKLVHVHWQTTAMMGLLKALPALLKLWEEGFIYPEQLAGLELSTYVSPLENRPSWRGRQQPTSTEQTAGRIKHCE